MYNNFSSKKTKKVISALLATALVATSAPISADAATAKVVGVGKTITYNAKAKVKKVTVKNKKIVTAKKSGKKVTIKGKKAGKTTVTIKTTKKTIKLTVKVGATKITKKTVTTSMVAGTTKALKVNAVNGKGDTIKFTSSNKSTVKVNKASAKANSKKVAGTTVTALKAGTAKIKATSKYTGKSKTFTITVVDATPTVTPSTNPAIVATTPAATANTNPGTNPGGSTTTNAPQATTGAATTAPGSTDVANTNAPSSTDVVETPAASAEATAEATIAPSFDPVTAKEGTLTVTANVSGASVKVISGGATVASLTMNPLETSVTTSTLQPGTYTVEITKKGYDKKTETVVIDGNKTLNVSLTEEVVLGASATVTNSLIEYDNTVLVNDNAIVTITVKDKDGNLVPGKTVVLSATTIGLGAQVKVQGQNVQTTDANGRASFVVGLDVPTTDSTDITKVTSAEFSAKVLDVTDGTNSTVTGCVGFAALDLATVSVDDATIDNDKLEVGKNAYGAGYTTATAGIASTYSLKKMTGTGDVSYISTQKVSSEGKDEHEVTFNVNPKIQLPQMKSTDTEAIDFVQPVNEKSGDYFTYATKEKVIPLKVDASKLQYATLMFNNIEVSKYTKLVITSYTDVECDDADLISGSKVEIEGEHVQKDFGYQIPLTADSNGETVKAVKVSLQSAGQVQTDKNSGYDIEKIVGVYDKSNGSTSAGPKEITTAKVSWETVNPTMSNFVKFTDEEIETIVKDEHQLNIEPKAPKNKFDYQVPVFPYTGDAVIREFDSNQNIVAYYLVPTVKGVTPAAADPNKEAKEKLVNTNIIKAGTPAYEATAEEAMNHSVGTIKENGNNVVVNSAAVGSTNLQGTISLPSLGGDVLDATNKHVYTSVQWNPLPKDAEVATSDAFLALAGQNITVYAQLSDKNGNPVSLAEQKVTYTLNNTSGGTTVTTFESNQTGLDTLNGTAVVKNTTTDVNGRATLTLNSAQANVIDDLKATAGNYDVILYIGDGKASTADLYWVNADLGFKKDVDDADYQRTNNDTVDIDTDRPDVSTPWQYAVKTVGNIFEDDADTHTASYYKKFKNPGTLEGFDISIDGLKVNTKFDEDNKGTYEVAGNGVVNATSNREYKDIIINELNDTSVGSNVTFTATKGDVTKTYNCVGEGNANLTAKMKLNVSWVAQGSMLSITSPAGTTISRNINDGKSGVEGKTNASGSYYGHADLYVKVTDATGKNPKEGTVVTFKSGTDTDKFSDGKWFDAQNGAEADHITSTATTDGNGVAHIVLNVAKTDQKSSVITASVDGVNEVATTTINWVKYEKSFELVNAGLSSEDAKQLVLTFNDKVEASSVNKDMFEVKNNGDSNLANNPNYGKKYEITNATANGRYVYLTLKNTIPTDTYKVSIADTTVDSVKYTLSDEKGVAVTKTSADFYSDKTGSFNAVVSYATADEATITVSNIKTGIELTDLNSGGIDATDVQAYAQKYFVVTVDGVIQPLAATAVGATYTTAGMSFKFNVPQTGADQKVAIYYLGGSETYTVKAADDLAQVGAYQVDNSNPYTVTIKFNRYIDFAANKSDADIAWTDADDSGNDVTVTPLDGSATDSVILTFDNALSGDETITIPAGVLVDSMGYTNEEIKISAVDIASPVTQASDVTVTKVSDTKFTLKFKEAIDEASISGGITFAPNSGSVAIDEVELSKDGKTVTVTLDGNVASSDTFSVTTTLTDIHGNAASAVVVYTEA